MNLLPENLRRTSRRRREPAHELLAILRFEQLQVDSVTSLLRVTGRWNASDPARLLPLTLIVEPRQGARQEFESLPVQHGPDPHFGGVAVSGYAVPRESVAEARRFLLRTRTGLELELPPVRPHVEEGDVDGGRTAAKRHRDEVDRLLALLEESRQQIRRIDAELDRAHASLGDALARERAHIHARSEEQEAHAKALAEAENAQRQALENSARRVVELDSELAAARTDSERESHRAEVVAAELEEARAELRRLEAETAESRTALVAAEAARDAETSAREEAERRLEAISAEAERQREHLAQRGAALERVEADLEQVQTMLAELEVDVAAAREEKDAAEAELARVRELHSQVSQELEERTAALARREDETDALRSEIDTARDHIASQRAELDQARDERAALAQELGSARGDLATVSESLSATETRLHEVLSELETVRADSGRRLEELDSARAELTRLEGCIERSRRELDQTQSARDAALAAREETERRLKELSDEAARQREQLEARGTALEQVDSELLQARAMVAELETRVARASEAKTAADAEVDRLQVEQDRLSLELGERAATIAQQRELVESLRADLANTQAQVASQNAQLESLRDDASAATHATVELDRTRDRCAALERDLGTANRDLAAAAESREAAETQLRALHGELVSARREASGGLEELDDARRRIAESEAEVADARASVERLSNEVESLRADNDRLATALTEATAAVAPPIVEPDVHTVDPVAPEASRPTRPGVGVLRTSAGRKRLVRQVAKMSASEVASRVGRAVGEPGSTTIPMATLEAQIAELDSLRQQLDAERSLVSKQGRALRESEEELSAARVRIDELSDALLKARDGLAVRAPEPSALPVPSSDGGESAASNGAGTPGPHVVVVTERKAPVVVIAKPKVSAHPGRMKGASDAELADAFEAAERAYRECTAVGDELQAEQWRLVGVELLSEASTREVFSETADGRVRPGGGKERDRLFTRLRDACLAAPGSPITTWLSPPAADLALAAADHSPSRTAALYQRMEQASDEDLAEAFTAARAAASNASSEAQAHRWRAVMAVAIEEALGRERFSATPIDDDGERTGRFGRRPRRDAIDALRAACAAARRAGSVAAGLG